MTENIRSLKGAELRQQTDADIAAAERAAARMAEWCQCFRPVPGLRYLRQVQCARCRRWIPKERLKPLTTHDHKPRR